MMDSGTPLEGACSCGRNHYFIAIPSPVSRRLQVIVDDRARDGYPVSLRVPLSHLHSTTFALYPGETHNLIRRVFTPYHAPHTKRHFCGFCGTPLSSWNEATPEEAEWIAVNMSSLRNESVERLQDAGLLAVEEDEAQKGTVTQEDPHQTAVVTHQANDREVRGVPWFEEMVEGSELGRIKRRRGGHTSRDGRTTYEWEVVEIGGDETDSTATNTAKRKLGTLGDEDDVVMKSG